MPIPSINFASIPVQKEDYSGIQNLIPNILEGYHAPKKMQEERAQAERKKQAEELANKFLKEYGPRKNEAEIGLKEAQTGYYNRMPGEKLGAGGKQYAPSYLTKMFTELEDAKAGYLPGSARTIPIDPENQQEIINRLELSTQKYTTDSAVRQRSLFANNLVKTIDNTNVDDLTQYSGPGGQLALKGAQTRALAGFPSEEYTKYQEALTAAKLEAKEVRQFFGDSITPEIQKAIDDMVNPTGWGTDPATAKAKINKSRDVIKKQLKTYQEGLQSKAPYVGGKSTENERALNNLNPDVINAPVKDMVTIKNSKTGETKTVTRDEAERMMKGGT